MIGSGNFYCQSFDNESHGMNLSTKVQIFSYFELELELGHRGWCLARLCKKKSNQSADTALQTGFSASVLNKGNIVQIMN